MEYINHFTLNTGHCRKSYPTEIHKEFMFNFLPLVKNIINDGGIVPYYKKSYIQITLNGNDQYVATLFTEHNNKKMPVFITFATSNSQKRKQIEQDIKVFRSIVETTGTYIVPDTPFMVDIILPAANLRMDLLGLTGDLSRCLAWTILDPESVLQPVKEKEKPRALKVTSDDKISIIEGDLNDHMFIQKEIGGYFEFITSKKIRKYFGDDVIMVVNADGTESNSTCAAFCDNLNQCALVGGSILFVKTELNSWVSLENAEELKKRLISDYSLIVD